MADTHTITNEDGRITVTAGVLAKLVRTAAESVDGARARRPKRGVAVELDGDGVRVALELAIRYGEVVPEVAAEVQRRVHEALRDQCALETSSVDVSVEELDT